MIQTAESINLYEHGSVDMSEHHDSVKNIVDVISVFAAVGAFLELLTPLFGLIGAVLGLMRIIEMVTGKEFVDIIRKKKDAEQE
jgi:hypothetical protein